MATQQHGPGPKYNRKGDPHPNSIKVTAGKNEHHFEVKTPSYFRKGTREHFENRMGEVHPQDKEDNVEGLARKSIRILERAGEITRSIEEVRKANNEDPTTTTIGGMVNTYSYAQKKQKELYKMCHKAEEELRERISQYDKQINKKLEMTAAHGEFAKEAREYLRSLPDDERRPFVREAILSKDWETVEYILGAKPYLSGLSKDQLESLEKFYRNERYGQELETRKYLKKMADNIGQGYTTFLENVSVLDTPEVREAARLQGRAIKAMDD